MNTRDKDLARATRRPIGYSTGIVMAGGTASRMPNKLLLSTGLGSPVIDHAIRLSTGLLDRTVVVVREGEIPHLWVRKRWREAIAAKKLVIQVQRSEGLMGGLCDALKDLPRGPIGEHENIAMLFADNYYRDRNRWTSILRCMLETKVPHASVKMLKNDSLDFYNGLVWDERQERTGKTMPSLAGLVTWPRGQKTFLDQTQEHGLVGMLNRMCAFPWNVASDVEWWDLGTTEGYADMINTVEGEVNREE
jgi:hypothetical protein